ncbi:hypothetical protein KQ660_00010 [Escherichia coli]|nr:hypothetical protein [Escherichia coli]
MVRETADSTTDQLQNRTLWSSYTEIIDVKQCYPNTAIVGLQVDAGAVWWPAADGELPYPWSHHPVPSNYDPEKRTYSGIWDGSLKPAYSNNPARCLWDMLTHPRATGWENARGRGCGQVGTVCHRAVLRPDGPGWFRRHRAADDL